MPLQALQFRPGIVRETTRYANEGGWFDCDKIRFVQGLPETIGGWTTFIEGEFLGTCRAIYSWSDLTGRFLAGFGTTYKYYVYDGTALNDITPIRETTAAGDVTFSATNGSSELTVSDTSHGAVLDDFVTFSGAVSLGGNVTADELNKEFQITSIIDNNTYTVELAVTANASDTGNGGGSVVGEYQINVGLNDATSGTGWGTDPWGDGGWGEASDTAIATATLRLWSHDNFGEDLIFNVRDGGVYYWDRSIGVATRAIALSDLSGANLAPTVASFVMVSDQDRHVIAFGADPEDNIGTQDPLLIRFSDQENAAEWQTRTTNTAGSLRVSSGSRILSAVQTKREIAVFTDVALHSMQFLGPPFTFGLQEISRNTQLISQNAAVGANDQVYWMSRERFMVYDGTVRELACTVREYVFDRLNQNQRDKIYGTHMPRFNEVWWLYPNGEECDSYVIYNYAEDLWYYGSLDRTAMSDRGLFGYPIATATDQHIYYHEFGLNDGSQNPPVGINAFIESSGQDIGDGEQYVFASRIIPDLTFRDSSQNGTVNMTVTARDYPGASNSQSYSTEVTRAGETNFTDQVFIRLRGRSFAMRFESNDTGTAWRIGKPRIDIRTDGRR